MKTQVLFLIQASSTSWQGEVDACMKIIENKSVIEHTLTLISTTYPNSTCIIIAPEFDRNGKLLDIAQKYNCKVQFSHDASPAHRIYDATTNCDPMDIVLRIDALNFCVTPDILEEALHIFSKNKLDFLKFSDDFPPQLSFEIYRRHTIEKMINKLPGLGDIFHIHLKHTHSFIPQINTSFFTPKQISDALLSSTRKKMSLVYEHPRGFSSNKAIKLGDQLSFHYDLVLPHINKDMKVLDIACGDGTGSVKLAKSSKEVIAADIDEQQIQLNIKSYDIANLKFIHANGEDLSFQDNTFDIITSMETIEHCEHPDLFLKELKRVLVPGGKLFISTPQSALGHIPLNIAHNIEYSLDQFKEILERHFVIEEFKAIKSGRIIIENSPIGQNSFAICRNDKP